MWTGGGWSGQDVDKTDPKSCPQASFGISGAEPSSSVLTVMSVSSNYSCNSHKLSSNMDEHLNM